MTDLRNPVVIWMKGVLFLMLGILAAILLMLEAPSIKIALLFCLSVWAFCRSYYFAFYVIQHYVDPEYRFSGLFSFLQYAIRKHRGICQGREKER